jgi:hypothetical protein
MNVLDRLEAALHRAKDVDRPVPSRYVRTKPVVR